MSTYTKNVAVYILLLLLIVGFLTTGINTVIVAVDEEIPYGGKLTIAYLDDVRTKNIPHSDYQYTCTGCRVWPAISDRPWVYYEVVDSVATPKSPVKWFFTDWEVSEDGLVWTVHLARNATFHDGEPVTAEDVKWTADNLIKLPTWEYANVGLNRTEVVDDYTVKFYMNFPRPYPPMDWTPILPKHIWEPYEDDLSACPNEEMIGSGWFKLKEWKAASHLIFEANPNYWRGRPALDEIHIMIVPDDEAQMAAIKTGDTDIGVFLSYADIPTIEELPDVDLVSVLGGYNEGWFFNLNTDATAAKNGHPALQDVRVRQAIAYAVDFDAICEKLLYGKTYPPATYWEETPYAYPDANPYKYDPEKAKALLDEAGWVDTNGNGIRDKDGVELILVYSTTAGREVREQTQVLAQQYLADVGIGIEIQNNSYDTMWNSYGEGGPIATGNYDIAEWSDGTDFPDPNVTQWLCSEIPSDENPAGTNWFGICDEELDALLRAQAVEMDFNKRIELFHEISRIINEKVYWLGVWHDNDLWAINKRVKNIKISGSNSFWNCWEWITY